MLPLAVAACSQTGERPYNEDAVRAAAHGGRAWAVLADGAGGHQGGAVASDLVARLIALELQAAGTLSPRQLDGAVGAAHQAVLERQRADGALAETSRMHTTAVVLWIDGAAARAVWSHVGDSRLYVLRGGRIVHVTRDDSVVQEMVDAGFLSADEARRHPRKNQLLRSIGVAEGFAPHTLRRPWPVRDGDAFLLCSDGWWDALPDGAIAGTLARAASVDDWLQRMEAAVRAAAVPGQDNYSAIAVWVGDPTQATVIPDTAR
jgi:serine/threonine protein phosphatase PrpC